MRLWLVLAALLFSATQAAAQCSGAGGVPFNCAAAGSALGAGDYVLASSTLKSTAGIIDPRALTASLTGSVVKTYNGTTAASLTPSNYSLTGGIISGDTVSLNDPTTGTYATKDAGTNLLVSVSGVKLTGKIRSQIGSLRPLMTLPHSRC